MADDSTPVVIIPVLPKRATGYHEDHAQLVSRFHRCVKQWKRDTLYMSSIDRMTSHPCYLMIIGMGPSAIPLIFDELQSEIDHWFLALSMITGENPVKEEDAGDLLKMRDTWLEYARCRGWY